VIEDADAAAALYLVTVESKIHFLDAVAFGAGAEFGFGTRCPTAEENAVRCLHDGMIALRIT
jgi:hypothetical protein